VPTPLAVRLPPRLLCVALSILMFDLLIVGVLFVGVDFLECYGILCADAEFCNLDCIVRWPPTPLPRLPLFIEGLFGEDPEFKLFEVCDRILNFAGSTSLLLVTCSLAGITPAVNKALVL
jgi:hypothetical protein